MIFNKENINELPTQCSDFFGAVYDSVFTTCASDIREYCYLTEANDVKDCLIDNESKLSAVCSNQVSLPWILCFSFPDSYI